MLPIRLHPIDWPDTFYLTLAAPTDFHIVPL
jgi:hypothetical protein